MSDALAQLSREFTPRDRGKPPCPRCERRPTEARVVVQVKTSQSKSQRTWATRTLTLCGECAADLFRSIAALYAEAP